eukprot:scaffold436_cov336-Pavlova_lutheri.AAC.35
MPKPTKLAYLPVVTIVAVESPSIHMHYCFSNTISKIPSLHYDTMRYTSFSHFLRNTMLEGMRLDRVDTHQRKSLRKACVQNAREERSNIPIWSEVKITTRVGRHTTLFEVEAK